MSVQNWTIIDDRDDQIDGIQEWSSRETAGGGESWKVRHRTLRGGLSEGVSMVEVITARQRVFVLPTRGMGIWRAEVDDQVLRRPSPQLGPVHPAHVPIFDPSGLGWLEGFDEFVVRCGLESNGAPDFDANGQLVHPLHGRVANRPAHFVEVSVDDSLGTITLSGIVEESRFHFQKLRLYASLTLPLDGTAIRISDRVENFGGTRAEMQMLYHINLGEPLLAAGDEFIAPTASVFHRDRLDEPLAADWNHYAAGTAGKSEDCYFIEMQANDVNRTKVMLKSSGGQRGVAVGYNTEQLPCFTLWKNDVSSRDGYVTGLEPATNFPNCRSAEAAAGRVVSLESGESWEANVEIDYLASATAVEQIEQEIDQLGQG